MVIRRDLVAGRPVEFVFSERGYDYLVKNLGESNIYVSFGILPESTDDMICIPPQSWQRHICQTGYVNSVWVIGTESCADGAEVECLRTRQVQSVANMALPTPIMRNQIADYLNVDGEYVLMGVGFSSLDETPNAKAQQKTYVCDNTATTVISSYQTEFPYTADMISSQEAVMALWRVGRNHLTGADAMFEYVRVDLFSPVIDQPNVYEARHFVVTNEVSNNPGEGGNPMTISGTLKCVGNLTLGTFDTLAKVFYPN